GQYNRIYLYDSDGTTSLGSAEGPGGATFTKTGLAAGIYYARVYYYSGSYFSEYSLTASVINADYENDVEDNGAIATAVNMLTNSTMYGHIGHRLNGGSYDYDDYYEIVTHSSGDITLSFTNTNGAFNRIYLYNSGGSSLGSAEGAGGASKTYSDLAAGTYYARMYYYSTAYFSSYALTNTYCPDAITIEASGETTLCEGESVTLSTPDHHLSYLWSDGSTTETNAVTLEGEFSLTIDNGDGCVRTSNVLAVDVTPNPVAIIEADGPITFCEGGDVTLSVDLVPDSYLWSNGATTPTITVSETGDYSVLLTKNDCSAISDPIHVEVNANPVATISADGPTNFCEGNDVVLTASAGASYVWSNGATTSSITVDDDGVFSVTVTNAAGCSDASLATEVTENANPTATISADGPTTFCTGDDVVLTASAGASYAWSNGASTASITVTTSGDYSVIVTNAAGCSDMSDVTSVTAESCGSVSIVADGPTEFCEGGSVTLMSSEASGNEWNTGETTQSIVVTLSGDYFVVNDENISNTISVTVNANPLAEITADGPTTFCEGSSVNLSSSPGADYLWSTGETSSSIDASAAGDYSVTVTSAEGCSSTSSEVTVIVNDNPDPTISADGSTSFCEGSVDLSVDGSYDSYLWSTGETTPTITVTGSGSYSAMVTDANGCSGVSNAIEITAGTAPTVSVVPIGSVLLCYGATTELVATTSGGNLQWYKNGVAIPGETGTSYFAGAKGLYHAVATDGGCSSASNSVYVNEKSKFDIYPAGYVAICPGGSVIFSAPLHGDAIYQWYHDAVLISGATSNTYEATMAGKYTCTVTRLSDGCTYVSKNVKVVISCKEAQFDEAVSVYPNPAIDAFTVSYAVNNTMEIQIVLLDMTGKMISAETKLVEKGNYTASYSTQQLPSGVYLLQVYSADGMIGQEKLVIEK
ncbi:MAG: T9SS type A sorting domain-containing protein, partial [Chitinophagales bacterium]|nr:T9SS type A sorting domain-containing protein [Chitinophagales bacterium]